MGRKLTEREARKQMIKKRDTDIPVFNCLWYPYVQICNDSATSPGTLYFIQMYRIENVLFLIIKKRFISNFFPTEKEWNIYPRTVNLFIGHRLTQGMTSHCWTCLAWTPRLETNIFSQWMKLTLADFASVWQYLCDWPSFLFITRISFSRFLLRFDMFVTHFGVK